MELTQANLTLLIKQEQEKRRIAAEKVKKELEEINQTLLESKGWDRDTQQLNLCQNPWLKKKKQKKRSLNLTKADLAPHGGLQIFKLRVRDDQDLQQVVLAHQKDRALKMRLKVLKAKLKASL